jgi:hypothetical protein
VLVPAGQGGAPEHCRWLSQLATETRESIRLYGAAAIPAHFPPFTGSPEYAASSAARTAAIIRNTRRLYRLLVAQTLAPRTVTPYQHGLYLTLAPRGNPQIKQVKHAAASLCEALAAVLPRPDVIRVDPRL